MAERRLRRHRGLFWSAVALALAALVGGSLLAYVTYAATAGPDGAVKGYFAALARGDAPAALGFGELPSESPKLLTSTVLRQQLKIAAIRHVEIIATDQSGDAAMVSVQYQLAFAAGTQQISEGVKVLRRKGSWQLARTAASTQLHLRQAAERATIAGAAIPDGPLLIFPGAVPITFDTPYLSLDAATSSVTLSAKSETDLSAEVTATGRSAADAAVATALGACLAAGLHADPRCPLATSRAVPGSLRARVSAAGVRSAAVVQLAPSSKGVIAISGTITLRGSYAVLDFDNQPVAKRGAVTVPLAATAFAVAPVTIDWAGP